MKKANEPARYISNLLRIELKEYIGGFCGRVLSIRVFSLDKPYLLISAYKHYHVT